MNKKIIVIMMIMMIIVGCGRKTKIKEEEKEQPKIEINKEPEVIGEKELEEGIVVKSTTVITTEEGTKIMAIVENRSEEEKYINSLEIIMKDEKEEEIGRLKGYILKKVKAGEEKEIETKTNEDLSKVKKIEYKVINE